MHDDAPMNLWELRNRCERVLELIEGKTFETLLADPMFRDAVYWNVVTIGEAMVRLRDVDRETCDKIECAYQVIGFRNRLIHRYEKIDDAIVWKVVTTDVPALTKRITAMLPPL